MVLVKIHKSGAESSKNPSLPVRFSELGKFGSSSSHSSSGFTRTLLTLLNLLT